MEKTIQQLAKKLKLFIRKRPGSETMLTVHRTDWIQVFQGSEYEVRQYLEKARK